MMAGIVCGTWVSVNRGTSKRSVLVPGGDVSSVATRKGNIQITRTGMEGMSKGSQLCCNIFAPDFHDRTS